MIQMYNDDETVGEIIYCTVEEFFSEDLQTELNPETDAVFLDEVDELGEKQFYSLKPVKTYKD